MPVPLDEHPVHQLPLSMGQVGTTDRNFYDRCYFNAHDRSGESFLVTGLGFYPNLGVRDAYAVMRRGDRQWAVRCSDALDERTLDARVGPYRVEVAEPLKRIRVVCDTAELGLGFDLVWEGSFGCIDEPRHLLYQGSRLVIDSSRFAQLGRWSGTVHLDGKEIEVTPERWMGSRDRSWGIRPVGEPEPAGRGAEEGRGGFWWLYCPLQFEDFAVVVIVQEEPDGTRTLNAATRAFGSGRTEQLGWPEVEIAYKSGTRHPEKALIHMKGSIDIEVETLTSVPLNVGAGYGGDPDWSHGQWRGREWLEATVYDLDDPAIADRIPFGVVDHLARASCEGNEGWGLFEHASIGRHDPSGFADWSDVAP